MTGAVKVSVRFNQQQLALLDKLKKEGTFGDDYEEIVLRVFRQYVKEKRAGGGA